MADTYPETFDGYRIVRPAIGRGGAGVVHDALAPDGRRVAIKILDRPSIEARLLKHFEERSASTAGDSTEPTEETRRAYGKYVERFKEEYQVLAGFNHPNIAKVRHIGFYEGQFYIVSEFVDGKPIAEHVRGWKPAEMIPLFVQALSGLDYIHRNGLIHLDIKSENILVQTKGDEPQIKIIDFGIAMQPVEYTGSFIGSVPTMAPEVALGLKDQVDARADLYSFGSVMYQCISWGSFPFIRPGKGDREAVRRAIEREGVLRMNSLSSVHHSRPGLMPEFLDRIVVRLLAHNPADRFYGNARAVINALATHMPDLFQDGIDTRGAYLRPERGKVIGRDREIDLIGKNVGALVEGKQPPIPIFSIEGGNGMGKSCLLKHLRDSADKHVETISIHALVFPATDDAIEDKIANLSRQLAENSKPILVLIDNLHELSPQSNAASAISGLIRLIVERKHKPDVYTDVRPAMLVFTTTTTNLLPIGIGDASAAQAVELKPFGIKDVEAYLLSTPALRGKEISAERIEALHRRTGGNPRELAEALEELDDKGIIFDAAGDIVFAEGPAPARPPLSTHERIIAGYRALPPAERHIVELMACWCLKPFLPPLRSSDIFALIQSVTLTQTLHALAQMNFIEYDTTGDAYAFFDRDYAPALIHEAMGEEGRERLHDMIADYLDAKPKLDRNAVRYHRALGTDKSAALRNCIFLGRNLLYREGRCRVAIELFERALNLASTAPPTTKQVCSGIDINAVRRTTTKQVRIGIRAYILSLLADAYSLADMHFDGEKTDALWRSIEEIASPAGEVSPQWKIVLNLKLIAHHLRAGKYDEAKKLIDSLKLTLESRGGAIHYILILNYEARYYYELALLQVEHLAEFMSKARETYDRSERLEQQVPHFDPRRVKNNSLPLVLRALGQLSAAAKKLKAQIDERDLNIFSQVASYADLADIYRMERRYDAAVACARKSLAIAERTLSGRLLFNAHEILANIHHDTDDFMRSLEERNRQIAASACFENKNVFTQNSTRIWAHMGHCYKELKGWDRAAVYFDAAIASSERPDCLMSAHQGLGEVCFHKGDFDRMDDCFAKAQELLDDMPTNAVTDSYRYTIARLKVESFLGKNDVESARRLMPVLQRLSDGNVEKNREYKKLEKRILH